MYTCKCGKSYDTQRSLNSHATHCELYEKKIKKNIHKNDDGSYVCECGSIFNNHQSLNGHFSHCIIHRKGLKKDYKRKDPFKDKRGWNKGLTKETDERLRIRGEKLSLRYKSGELEHYFSGKKHKENTKEKISEKRIDSLKKNELHCKWYEVFNGIEYIKVQGTWEKRIGEALTKMNEPWERVQLIYNGHRKYTPDFYLPNRNMYIEVKGWWKYMDFLKMEKVLNEHAIDIRSLDVLKEIRDFENCSLKIDDIKSLDLNTDYWKNKISKSKEYYDRKYQRNEIDSFTDEQIKDVISNSYNYKQAAKTLNVSYYHLMNFVSLKNDAKLKEKERKEKKVRLKSGKIRIKTGKDKLTYCNDIKTAWNNEQQKYIDIVLNSGIDFSKFGWVTKVASIINQKPQRVHIWMKRILPEFYEKECFKRKK